MTSTTSARRSGTSLKGIVGYRVTDANWVDALTQAQRRPLEKLYDEVVAARQLEPQVLIRPGIGQVLNVR